MIKFNINKILLIITLELVIKSYNVLADVTQLCSDGPIDSAFTFMNYTYITKGSNVWVFTNNDIKTITGPLPISGVFTGIDIKSIDAAFHIVPEYSTDTNTLKMLNLIIAFKDNNYYIFHYMDNGGKEYFFRLYNNTQGIPYNLNVGNGSISLLKFIPPVQRIDATVLNGIIFDAYFFVGTDAYILNFKTWVNLTANPIKANMIDLIGVNEKIEAVFQTENRQLMIFFNGYYCLVDLSELKCTKQLLSQYFSCPSNSMSTVLDISSTLVTNDNDLQTEEKSEERSSIFIVFLIIAGVVLIVIALTLIILFLVIKSQKDDKNQKSGVGSQMDKSTTFSSAFSPKHNTT